MKSAFSISLKSIALLITFLFAFNNAFAQDNNKSDFWKKVRFGSGIGLNAGNNIFSATVAPSAIYDFNKQFSLGVGLNASYLSSKNVFKSTLFGASIISLYSPINEIQLSGELEQNYVRRNFSDPALPDDRFWVPSLFVGAGYRTRNVTIGLRYDLLYNENKSVYANAWAPFVRVYF